MQLSNTVGSRKSLLRSPASLSAVKYDLSSKPQLLLALECKVQNKKYKCGNYPVISDPKIAALVKYFKVN